MLPPSFPTWSRRKEGHNLNMSSLLSLKLAQQWLCLPSSVLCVGRVQWRIMNAHYSYINVIFRDKKLQQKIRWWVFLFKNINNKEKWQINVFNFEFLSFYFMQEENCLHQMSPYLKNKKTIRMISNIICPFSINVPLFFFQWLGWLISSFCAFLIYIFCSVHLQLCICIFALFTYTL